MALSITEATAVNRLYDWLVDRDSGIGRISNETAREAMATLARGAKRTLMAGVTEQQVAKTPLLPSLNELRAHAAAWEAVDEILRANATGKGHASAEQERLACRTGQPPDTTTTTRPPASRRGAGRKATPGEKR
jgi:hypothetical protein